MVVVAAVALSAGVAAVVARGAVGSGAGRGGRAVFGGNTDFQCGFDALECTAVARPDKGDGLAVGIGTGCTPNAVHIILRFTRHIEIHYEHHLVDVDAACQQVGGYNHFDSSGTEPTDSLVALLLIEVGMDFGSFDAETAQVAGKVAHTMLRGGKHNHALPFAAFQYTGENFLLFIVIAEDC